MKFTDLQNMSEAESGKMLQELQAKAHDLSVKMKLGQVKNTSELKGIKKDIARILTHLHLKKV